ncbi:hypothetical protein [Paraburkholderia kururiensis]|uniref:Uncharacterized protein n=1 Tax=Paraburkholderia kururiensis TaxID=984307 RepID=A0ABZ0WDY9_9BURK|nr:hypothetical protein [Paraburkholderia kururiensis]WQD75545.1 hypothetical protein U0042_15390 [Paraburkholderia kururiensis]
MTTAQKKARSMPKGGRKGGTIFPRVALVDALGYARKLVSKTHTSAQPKEVIFSGVVGAKTGLGDVRVSALRQYGFLKGDAKSNFSADELAKQIVAAPQEELIPLYRRAVLKPVVFKKLFDTFHGDTVTKSKLKQRAADLKVHPDETETCVDLYVSGLTTAGLVTVEGDRVTHMTSDDASAMPVGIPAEDMNPDLPASALTDVAETGQSNPSVDMGNEAAAGNGNGANIAAATPSMGTTQSGPRAVFNVNVTLDSSMDIEKLQKQLELLKRFGAI